MNKETLNNVVAAAKAKAANSPAWTRCLDKAAKMLESGELCATVLNDGVLVTSPRGSYLVTAGHCPCAARTPHCYHRCAARIASLMDEAERAEAAARRCDAIIEDIHAIAAEVVATKAATRVEIIEEIRAAWSARFPGESLADELLRRFKKSKLEMLSVDFLVAIRAAIA